MITLAKRTIKTQLLPLCCVGALVGFAACSSASAAQSYESPGRTSATNSGQDDQTDDGPTITRPWSRPQAQPTTVPDLLPAITLPITLPVTLPVTTIPETTVPPPTLPPTTTTTLPLNVQVVGPWLSAIVAVGKSDGPDTAIAKTRLMQLGFWAGDGGEEYDFATTQAVMAFQKYMGLDPSGKLDEETAGWLTIFPERAHGAADDGTLVEVDKVKQLLFLIVDGQTTWAFNTSTGSGIAYVAHNQKTGEIETGDAVTPNGLWRTNRERPNGWWEGDLGDIYRPKYFRGGVAIHGMTRVPSTPVSHGCVRLSTAAMDFIWDNNLIPLGTPVWVHEYE